MADSRDFTSFQQLSDVLGEVSFALPISFKNSRGVVELKFTGICEQPLNGKWSYDLISHMIVPFYSFLETNKRKPIELELRIRPQFRKEYLDPSVIVETTPNDQCNKKGCSTVSMSITLGKSPNISGSMNQNYHWEETYDGVQVANKSVSWLGDAHWVYSFSKNFESNGTYTFQQAMRFECDAKVEVFEIMCKMKFASKQYEKRSWGGLFLFPDFTPPESNFVIVSTLSGKDSDPSAIINLVFKTLGFDIEIDDDGKERRTLEVDVYRLGNLCVREGKTLGITFLTTTGDSFNTSNKTHQRFFRKLLDGLPHDTPIKLDILPTWENISAEPIHAVTHVVIFADARSIVPVEQELLSIISNYFMSSGSEKCLQEIKDQVEWFQKRKVSVSLVISHWDWLSGSQEEELNKRLHSIQNLQFLCVRKLCDPLKNKECRDYECGHTFCESSKKNISRILESLVIEEKKND
jgi:hypothetical protein